MSLALNTPLPESFAMTGEINLRGKVTRIGGVKEKILGGKRSGIRNFIFSKENQDDVEELKDDVKSDARFFFVEDYREIYDILFENVEVA